MEIPLMIVEKIPTIPDTIFQQKSANRRWYRILPRIIPLFLVQFDLFLDDCPNGWGRLIKLASKRDVCMEDACTECGGHLEYVGKNKRVYRTDPEMMTGGQMADQFAAELGGFFEEGVHGETTYIYACMNCGQRFEVSR